MIDSILTFLGMDGAVLSSDVAFAIGAGFIFLVFCVFLVCLSAVFGRWFR